MRAIGRVHSFLLVAAISACTSPTRPSGTVTSGQPLTPAPDATISFYDQPVSVAVTPGVSTAGVSTTVVEVATDPGFASIIMTKPVAPSVTSTSTVTLDRLNASTTYYWRATTTTGENPSVISRTARFTIGPQLIVEAPTALSPVADSFPRKRPTFRVKNAASTGPPANLACTFEVSRDADFAVLVTSATVPESAQETSFVPLTDLQPGAGYFWRARASDPKTGVVGENSAAQIFTTVFPDDGRYRYMLVVRTPSWCLTHFVAQSQCSPPADWYQSDFGLEGSLKIDGDRLRFALPRVDGPRFNEGPLVFEALRTGNRLSGRLSGTTWAGPAAGLTLNLSGMVSGGGDNTGRFDGRLDGRIALWSSGFPCDKYVYCTTPDIRWTLLPR